MDCYTSPVDAIEYGRIDGVITQVSIIPLMPIPDQVKSTLSYEPMMHYQNFINPCILNS